MEEIIINPKQAEEWMKQAIAECNVEKFLKAREYFEQNNINFICKLNCLDNIPNDVLEKINQLVSDEIEVED